MSDHSRNERKGNKEARNVVRKIQYTRDAVLDKVVPRACKFRMFRTGVDECAWCRRPRSEHK